MNKRFKSFIFGLMGVPVGLMIGNLIRDGEIDWSTIGLFITLIFLILLFRLGLHLYKKRD